MCMLHTGEIHYRMKILVDIMSGDWYSWTHAAIGLRLRRIIMLKDYLILDLTEILTEIHISQDATVLLLDKESAEGLIEMIREQLGEFENNY